MAACCTWSSTAKYNASAIIVAPTTNRIMKIMRFFSIPDGGVSDTWHPLRETQKSMGTIVMVSLHFQK